MTTLFAPLMGETEKLVENLRQSVVQIQTAHGNGSGVIWESEGLIVTNYHVVPRERATVELTDGRVLPATLIATDRHNDLALLHVPARDLAAAPIGDSTALRVGELIIAVGNPFGVRGTVTLGIISARDNRLWMGQTQREVLQADVALAPGNSGGPLADTAGRVVGIASMIVSPGIAVAIPSHVVTRFVTAARRAKAA